jgi:UDP-N-acetyl-D-glucosamine dehydrogenase
MPFYPGPGLGGHCIPIDPHYLSWKLRTLNYRTRFIELADDINNSMPDYVVSKVGTALNDASKPIRGSKILILGVAYKRDITDWRESPAVPIIRALQQSGANVDYQDNFVDSLPLGAHGAGDCLDSVELDYEAMSSYDGVVIVTDHRYFDVTAILSNAQCVVDTRNLTGQQGREDPKVVKL